MVFDSWSEENIPDQYGKIAVITGGCSGIGRETAFQLAMHNCFVIIGSPDGNQGEATELEINSHPIVKGGRGGATHVKLDLSDFKSVRNFVKQVRKIEKKTNGLVRLLINNASVFKPPHEITKDGFEITHKVNYFGTFLLTNLLLPKLAKNSPSRIITRTSDTSIALKANWHDLKGTNCKSSGAKEYARTKLMLHMFGVELHRRGVGAGVESYIVHPGLANTQFTRILGPLTRKITQNPAKGALSTLFCATSNAVIDKGGFLYGPKFGFFGNTSQVKRWRHQMTDSNDCLRLWKETEEILEMKRKHHSL